MKNKYAETITDTFSDFFKSSNRKPNLLETADGMEDVNKIFNKFLNINNIERYSRYTDKGAVFAERFNRTKRNLLKKPVFGKRNADWVSELLSALKKYNNSYHNTKKMTPSEASKKSKEKEFYSNLQDRRVRQQPKYNLRQLVRTADIKKAFSEGHITNWS